MSWPIVTPFTGLGARQERDLAAEPGPLSRTERLRLALHTHGRCSARTLAEKVGLESGALVGALLKHDIKIGKVKYFEGAYELEPDFDMSDRAEIATAIALLQRHGYKVTKA